MILKMGAECFNKWSKIAKAINEKCHQDQNVRSAHNVRDRYFNHLRPGLRKSGWTEEEDNIIIT